MDYAPDPALSQHVSSLIERLHFTHINPQRVIVVRSSGSKSRRTLARIHTLSSIFQHALSQGPLYVIEVLSENYNSLSEEEQVKTLIHELLHIPHSFGGGFRHHKTHVNRRTVDHYYKQLQGPSWVSRLWKG